MSRRLRTLVGVLCVSAAAVFLVQPVQRTYQYIQFDLQQDELEKRYTDKKEEEENREENIAESNMETVEISGNTNIPECPVTIDFASLREVNPDVIGWIYVPGTGINDPILLGDTDEEYLHTNWLGGYQFMGSIFAHAGSSEKLDDPYTVLFGHNMASGRMFGDLSNYENREFYKEYPYVYILTPEKTMACQVFSVQVVDYSDPDVYTDSYENGSLKYKNCLKSWVDNSIYPCGVEVDADDQVFCLSTCTDADLETNRFVILCKCAVYFKE